MTNHTYLPHNHAKRDYITRPVSPFVGFCIDLVIITVIAVSILLVTFN